MSNEQKPLPVAAWIEHHKAGDNLVWEQQKSSPRCTPLTPHAEAQALVEAERDAAQMALSVEEGMRKESDACIAVLTVERDAALADAAIAAADIVVLASERDAALADAKLLREALLRVAGAAEAAAPAAQPEAKRCPLCDYLHGHAIGCENNPVDIALAARAALAATGEPT